MRDNPDSKTNKAVEKIHQICLESAATKGAQLVFCDISTPQATAEINSGLFTQRSAGNAVAETAPREQSRRLEAIRIGSHSAKTLNFFVATSAVRGFSL